jgi:hypothetical protein
MFLIKVLLPSLEDSFWFWAPSFISEHFSVYKEKEDHTYIYPYPQRNAKDLVSQTPVAHSCNPSYSGGRNQEDLSSKPAWANISGRLYKKNK